MPEHLRPSDWTAGMLFPINYILRTRPIPSPQPTRTVAPIATIARLLPVLLLVLAAASCGTGIDDGPIVDLTSEYRVERAPAGMEEAVAVDSVFWQPLTAAFDATGTLEIDGLYRIEFRSTAERPLELRYDLRFLDDQGFLLDNFIPFGLPVVLQAEEAKLEIGEFVIRSGDIRWIYDVVTMRIVARIDTAGVLSNR